MPIYQATRSHPATNADEAIYVDADSRTQAIGALRRRGWVNAERLMEHPPGMEVPEDAEVVRVHSSRKVERTGLDVVAASLLMRQPILTIAAGVVVGIVAYQVLALLLAFLFGAIFGVD